MTSVQCAIFVTVAALIGCSRPDAGKPGADSLPDSATTTAPLPTEPDVLIHVRHPHPNDVVTSPLTITGEARGTWYFEASFPVFLIAASGDTLAVKPAQAQGEWMTENFVPFTVTLTFAAPAFPTGTLILKKDNPSGLPENDNELSIPVRFAP